MGEKTLCGMERVRAGGGGGGFVAPGQTSGQVVGKWTKVWLRCGLEWHSNRILLQLWLKLQARQKLCQQIDIASNLARGRWNQTNWGGKRNGASLQQFEFKLSVSLSLSLHYVLGHTLRMRNCII